MKIADMKPGETAYTQLATRVLAVLSRREDGWCVYVDAVPGECHAREWQYVLATGMKQREPVARAIVESCFFPGFDPEGVPYAR